MTAKSKTKKVSYEKKLEELEEILERLEESRTPIDELASDVKKATALIQELDQRLKSVETEVANAFRELEKDEEEE